MRALAIVFILLPIAVPVEAQISIRPTEPPVVTAANEEWYLRGEPLQFAGDVYYPAGPAVFFNGNTMVRSGHYNGVPLYTDTTVEPFSIVLVPISPGLLQPYERRRAGELAGTTGSRAPSFPVAAASPAARPPVAPSPPTALPAPIGAVNVFTPLAPAREVTATAGGNVPAATAAIGSVVTIRRPESNDGIWVEFAGERWVSAGPAIPVRPEEFIVVGDHAGFPVLARRELREEVIYLPTRTGLIAPYRRKE